MSRLRKPVHTVAIRAFEPRYGVATIIWCGIIFWASLTAEPPGGQLFDFPHGDKIVHFCGYAMLCWLAAMSLRRAARPYRAVSLIIVPVVFSIAYGILNETTQTLVASRSYESGDIVADGLGAVSVQAGFMCMQLRKKETGREKMVLVSACLLGVRCRYDGSAAPVDALAGKKGAGGYVPVCPEQLGGLPTPREGAHLEGGDGVDVLDGNAAVVTENGRDVTAHFLRGAEEVLRLALSLGTREAVLKERSPSCGVTLVHRETGPVKGMGVTTALLKRHGVKVEGI